MKLKYIHRTMFMVFIIVISLFIGSLMPNAVNVVSGEIVTPTHGSGDPSVSGRHELDLDVVGLLLTWQRDPTTTMTIDWHYVTTLSDLNNHRPGAHYRSEGEDLWTYAAGERLMPALLPDRIRYRTELTGLNPDTTYEFRLVGDDTVYRFRTMPASLHKPIRFAAGGDTRHRQDWMEEMNRVVMAYDPAFVVWGGDLAYANGERADLWVQWFDAIFNTFITDEGFVIPVVAGVGNHEVLSGGYRNHSGFAETDQWRRRIAPYFYGLLAFPGQPGYGALDFGDYLSLIMLDTNHTNSMTGVQLDWLDQTLAKRKDMRHIIPVYHVPAYPSVRSIGSASRTIQERWLPLFERSGVRVIFENHDHAYKRTVPILGGHPHPNGIVFFGDGSWGVTPRDTHSPTSTWYLAKAEGIRAGMIVTLSETEIHVKALAHTGKLIDEYTVVGGLYIESPEVGAVVGADEPVSVWVDSQVEVAQVIIQQNGVEIYRGNTLPEFLRLRASVDVKEDTPHELGVTVIDKNGYSRTQTNEFFVRHVFLKTPEQAARVQGWLSVEAAVGLFSDERIERFEINVAPIKGGERIDEHTVEEGIVWPGVVSLDTFQLEDGTYDLDLIIETDRGAVYSDTRRFIVRNWDVLTDPLEAPMNVAFFGTTLDRSKTSDRTDGWAYATDDVELFFGDDNRLVPTDDGIQHLTWHHPHLRRFDMTVYAKRQSVAEAIQIAVSVDGGLWETVPYRVKVLDRSDGEWLKLGVQGDVPGELDFAHIRFIWDDSSKDNDDMQLGHAEFIGLASQ